MTGLLRFYYAGDAFGNVPFAWVDVRVTSCRLRGGWFMGYIPHWGVCLACKLVFVYAAGRNVGWAQDGCGQSYLACSSLTFHGRLHMARLPSALQADSEMRTAHACTQWSEDVPDIVHGVLFQVLVRTFLGSCNPEGYSSKQSLGRRLGTFRFESSHARSPKFNR